MNREITLELLSAVNPAPLPDRLPDSLGIADDALLQLIEQRSETLEAAVAGGSAGPPTILVNGSDRFAVGGAEPGLACRVYPTPDGLRGTPTLNQLIAALTATKQSR